MGIESPLHLLFLAVVALVVLGPKRLPNLARALGKGIREFRAAFDEAAAPEQGGPSVSRPQPDAQQLAVPAQQPAAAIDPVEQAAAEREPDRPS
jgi:sec-independent protein translocase protein TatB